MFTTPKSLPSNPAELRIAAEGLVELAKTQALQIEKLKHQLAGHQRHRFGSKSESSDQLNLELKLEEEETAAARIAPPEDAPDPEPKQKPKRKPLPSRNRTCRQTFVTMRNAAALRNAIFCEDR